MYNRGRPGGARKPGQRSIRVFSGLPDFLKCLFVPDIHFESLEVRDKPEPLPMTGLGSVLSELEESGELQPSAANAPKEAPKEKVDTRKLAKLAKMEKHKAELAEKIAQYNPDANPKATKNAMNTLFIANLNYLTPESRLRDLCEKYGPIENLVMVHDLEGKSRGYAFVEYTHEDDMKAAYSRLRQYRLDGRTLIVDVERCRTVRKWLPARLGGGLGRTRIDRPKKQPHRRGDDRRRYEEERRRYEDDRRRYDDERRRYDDDRRRYDDDRRRYDDDRRRDYDRKRDRDDRHRDYDRHHDDRRRR